MVAPLFDSYLVYAVHPNRDRGVSRHLVGKYLTHDGTVHVVSDHNGILERMDGKRMSQVQGQLDRLHESSYYQVEKKDLTPAPISNEHDWENEAFKKAEVEVFRLESPQGAREITFVNGAFFDKLGPLSKSALEDTVRLVQDGKARLVSLGDLKKADLNQSFDALRALVQAGHLHPDHYEALRREMYQDEMVPSIGNKRAFHDFMKTSPQGVHMMLDANGLKSINDQLGHEQGDQAISAMGNAIRAGIDSTVGPAAAKAHRFGGDEFHIYAATPEHAHAILRGVREHLEKVPPLQGTHKLSMSAGIGEDPGTADKALYHAKAASKTATALAGGDPTARSIAPHAMYAHSLHPASPGPVPMSAPGG